MQKELGFFGRVEGVLCLCLATLLIFALVGPVGAQQATQQTAPQPTMQTQNSPEFSAAMKSYRQRRYADAVSQFQKVVEAEPQNAAAYYFMGYSHYVMKHYQEAQDAFGKAFAADPRLDPKPYFRSR
jgi:TolA-binding protein